MTLGETILLGVGLAADATAVSAARGLTVPKVSWRHAAQLALFFGGAQALMPILGWWLGDAISAIITTWGPWVAFAVLVILGLNMIRSARSDDDAASPTTTPFALPVLLLLALATSIDALAAGVSLALLVIPPWQPALAIGLITALLSVAGLLLGRRLGLRFRTRVEIFGGLVLIGLGVKALLEHTLSP